MVHQPQDKHVPVASGWYQSLKDAFTDLFEIPDEEIGWFLPALLAGVQTAKSEKIDVIYSTGRPWTAHLIGTALKRLTGKPLVADFRDPWLTNPFRLKYSTLRNQLETYCERKVIEKADVVLANTSELREEFIRRFPEQPQDKFSSLLNGFDPGDYSPEAITHPSNSGRPFTIIHTGFLYAKRDPKVFLKSVKMFLGNEGVDRRKVKILLVGSVSLAYDLEEHLRSEGLDDIVTLTGQVPYKQSLQYLQESDVLLLLQPGTATQVPSKLFEYLGMKKPILAISPHEGATYNLVLKESIGKVAQPDNVEKIAEAIYKMHQQWRDGFLMQKVNEETYEKFNVKNMTATLATHLSKLAPSL
jgi:glycosyltransferase involved in cell wall biosynthesis